ncbi:MAG: HD domain-containing protein [Steroidobacteraceae bacterium]
MAGSSAVSITGEILAIYAARGADAYFGERVSMTEHGLQAAWLGQAEGAPESLIVAALLHDIGHLIEQVPDALADWTADARHEEVGARWLARRFGPVISEPVRLHVPAKRYLCATDAQYFGRLSAASVHTLKLQGGPMSASEIAQFEGEHYFRQAVRVRRWDDQGKVAGLKTPPLTEYLALIEMQAVPP